MHLNTGIVCLLLSLVCHTLASPTPLQLHEKRATPAAANPSVKPSDDPFYISPVSNLSSYDNGAIIRWRPAPAAIASLNSQKPLNVKAVYQVLYRTSDSSLQPAVAVTTIIIPNNADPTKLLAYQTAYDQSDNNCCPSYTLQQGSNATTNANIEILLIGAALRQGWYVSTPDYEGIYAQYVAGLMAARGTLDSVRAALASAAFTNISANAQYSMWGYSGGSLASEWAAELQPAYAPELNFKGVALGGLVPNVSSIIQTVNNGPFTDLVPKGLAGLSFAYSNFSTWLDGALVPATAATFKSGRLCQGGADFTGQDMSKYFTGGFASLLGDPVPKSIFANAGLMGRHGTPQSPLYFYKALADEVSVVNDTTTLYNQFCATGKIPIQYRINTVGEHVSESITGASGALAFLVDRFNSSIPAPVGCTTQVVAVQSLDPTTDKYLGSEIISALNQILGSSPGAIL